MNDMTHTSLTGGAPALKLDTIMKPREAEAPKQLPTFKPKWWFRDNRLDARPVLWCLENHPEDFEVRTYGSSDSDPLPWLQLTHKPSKHSFVLRSFPSAGSSYLHDANCSCTSSSRQFQSKRQARALERAGRKLYESRLAPNITARNKQFMNHFVY